MKDGLELLASLVRCPSPSGNEAEVVALAAGIARELGLEVQRCGSSLVVRPPGHAGTSGPIELLLCSHLDTVPVGAGWSADPYAAEWRDGVLVGRGANDAKASVAAMLWALGECAAAGRAARPPRSASARALRARSARRSSRPG